MHCIDIDIDYSTFHLFEYRSITLDALLLFAICLHPSVLSFMLFQCALFAQPLTCFTFCHLSIQRLQQCSHIEFLALSLSMSTHSSHFIFFRMSNSLGFLFDWVMLCAATQYPWHDGRGKCDSSTSRDPSIKLRREKVFVSRGKG